MVTFVGKAFRNENRLLVGEGGFDLNILELRVDSSINPPLQICVHGQLILIIFICVPISGIVNNILSDSIQF